ncbi:hypothetical protein Tco_1483588 [Tanacetum coccineum]
MAKSELISKDLVLNSFVVDLEDHSKSPTAQQKLRNIQSIILREIAELLTRTCSLRFGRGRGRGCGSGRSRDGNERVQRDAIVHGWVPFEVGLNLECGGVWESLFSVRYLDSVRDKVSVCIVDSVYWDKFVYKDNSTYTGCFVLFYKVCIGSVSFKVLMIGHGSGLFDTDGASVRYLGGDPSGGESITIQIVGWLCPPPQAYGRGTRVIFLGAAIKLKGASVDQSLSSETRRYHDQAGRLLDSVREMKDSIVVNLVCIHVPIDALTLDGIDLDTPLPQAVMKWKTLVRTDLFDGYLLLEEDIIKQ